MSRPPSPHTPPPIVHPVPAAVNPLKLVKYLRTYDGKSDSSEFMDRLNADLAEYKISHEWIFRNFDRILVGEALAWFDSISPVCNYHARLPHADFSRLWKNLSDELRAFFNHDSLLNSHKKANRQLRYTDQLDPQSYVTQKLTLLRNIDPTMDDDKRVEQLIKGLPIPLQVQFAAVNINSQLSINFYGDSFCVQT